MLRAVRKLGFSSGVSSFHSNASLVTLTPVVPLLWLGP